MFKTTSLRKAFTFVESCLQSDCLIVYVRCGVGSPPVYRTFRSTPQQAWQLLFDHQETFKWLSVNTDNHLT